MTAYYNIIYNGNLELEKGKREVEAAYTEDYWAILPIERMAVEEKENPLSIRRDRKNKPSNSSENSISSFEAAEEKATKAIQKHSMFMGGREYNPQIDEAFLLLGKARYLDQRFIPAKDAFSFILNHYPESSTINEAKIWLQKTNLRLEYYDMVIKNLLELINTSELSTAEQYEASSTLAQAYIYEDLKRQAISTLQTAIAFAPDEEKKGRLLYIKGQLHSLLNEKDSARVSFNRVIALNRKTPRRYLIHSELEKLRLKGYEELQWFTTELAFKEMAENRENRPFLDFIYYDNAVFRRAQDSITLAIQSFNKSLRENPRDRYLKSQNYLNLGEIYFDKASYETAGKYYDSTLTNLAKQTREFRQIKRKRDNLEDVIKFERIAKTNDSIINLVNASEEERLRIFKDYTEKLKEEQKSVFAKSPASTLGNSRFGAQRSQIGGRQNSSSKFYFYDLTQKQRGEESFRKLWGDLELTDDWRANPQFASGIDEDASVANEDQPLKPEYDPETYIAQIPTDEKLIDSIYDERNFAYYQLGIIYKEKFREMQLAIDKLTSLLKSNPEKRLILPSKYYLYKIYLELEDQQKANYWKNEILNQHSDSRYASILRNPEAYKSNANNPQNVYKRLYNEYKSGQYQAVLSEIELHTQVFIGNSIVPKLELLKARVLAKLEGADAYKEALNYVALTYPQSEEGKYAQNRYRELERNPLSSQFDMKPDQQADYLLVFDFHQDSIAANKIQEVKENLSQALQEEEGLELNLNEDIYDQNQTLLTINGLKSKLGAEGLAEKFIKNAIIDKNLTYFVISQKNYRIAQINKNLDDYLDKIK
ncbi:hypothetical protein [Psychroflexus tropicus]|uniref:type IX secretion system periplasmic lipoprotein PorW/SprE n=1 Tax=Psychroflexus tropicus TaxID=197345 RepID=UPI000374DC16|nr:hypothetical protein [Psychroflexus tropicus]